MLIIIMLNILKSNVKKPQKQEYVYHNKEPWKQIINRQSPLNKSRSKSKGKNKSNRDIYAAAEMKRRNAVTKPWENSQLFFFLLVVILHQCRHPKLRQTVSRMHQTPNQVGDKACQS